jgi:hypothetical protein
MAVDCTETGNQPAHPAGERRERVNRALKFQRPDRVPMLIFNHEPRNGDILICNTLTLEDEQGTSEWGVKFKSLEDGTMGQMTAPPLAVWDNLPCYPFPQLKADRRRKNLHEFNATVGGYYRLASLGLSGFTCYCGVRGFENALMDFALGSEAGLDFYDRIMDFEKKLMNIAAAERLDGVIFFDDWGTQEDLIVSPRMWRRIFKPRYADQFRHAHELGLAVWFHCCGRIDAIIPDMHEIGVDVINISQPNLVNIENVGAALQGKQCFMVPISYQTISISGTPQEIHEEARRLYRALGTEAGGFIGYVEEYSCMGMSAENYEACKSSFRQLVS